MSLLNHVLSVKSKHKYILSILKQKVILISTQSYGTSRKIFPNTRTIFIHNFPTHVSCRRVSVSQSFLDIKKEIDNESTLNFHYNRLNELLVKKSWRMKAFISLIFSLVSGAGILFFSLFFKYNRIDFQAISIE